MGNRYFFMSYLKCETIFNKQNMLYYVLILGTVIIMHGFLNTTFQYHTFPLLSPSCPSSYCLSSQSFMFPYPGKLSSVDHVSGSMQNHFQFMNCIKAGVGQTCLLTCHNKCSWFSIFITFLGGSWWWVSEIESDASLSKQSLQPLIYIPIHSTKPDI